MNKFEENARDAIALIESMRSLSSAVRDAADRCIRALNGGGKLLICGNGGSAAEAQHLAGELLGRYKENRSPLAAMALTADSAVLTCIGNDFHFEEIFSRQVQALGRSGDVLITFTTSGRSPDILAALRKAKEVGTSSVSFLGRDGGPALALSDCALVVSHTQTGRIQEGHQFLMHCMMDLIEEGITRSI